MHDTTTILCKIIYQYYLYNYTNYTCDENIELQWDWRGFIVRFLWGCRNPEYVGYKNP